MPSQNHAEDTVDEIDALVARFDAVDHALGRHLIDELMSGSHGTQPGLSAEWFRTRIRDWCRAGAVESEFGREAVRSTDMAVEHMDDELIQAVGHGMMARARTQLARVAAPDRSAPQRTRPPIR